MTKKGLLTLAVVLVFCAGSMAELPKSDYSGTPISFFPLIDSYKDSIDFCNAEGQTGNVRLLGPEFDGTDYWVTGSGMGSAIANRLYRLDRNCTILDSLDQTTLIGGWGWRDLAYDEVDTLYASDEYEFVKFAIPPIGGPIVEIPLVKPAGISPLRALAYDPVTGHVWTANWSSNITEFDPLTGKVFCSCANTFSTYGMAWDDACYKSMGYKNPMLWVYSQNGLGRQVDLFDPVACAWSGEASWQAPGTNTAGGAAFDFGNYFPGLGVLLTLDQSSPDQVFASEICTEGVTMSCTNLTPVFCQSKNIYFQVTTNNTGAAIKVTMTFQGYNRGGCVPGNEYGPTQNRSRTIPMGTNTVNYFVKVPGAAGPGPYSAKVSFTHAGTTYECCMDFTCVQCQGWKIGDNTEWVWEQVDRPEVGLPTTTALSQNYPNPFNAETNIGYVLAEAGNVNLSVYDISGRLVETLVDGHQEAGEHIVTWNGSDVSSGIYFYKVATSDYTATKMMNLLK